jgi:hypothetical protein
LSPSAFEKFLTLLSTDCSLPIKSLSLPDVAHPIAPNFVILLSIWKFSSIPHPKLNILIRGLLPLFFLRISEYIISVGLLVKIPPSI